MLKRWCGNVYNASERNYQTFNKVQAKSGFGRYVGGHKMITNYFVVSLK